MSTCFFKATLSAFIAFGIAGTASADMPDEVIESYHDYKIALANQNLDQAEVSALAAWKAAEKSLGDTKETGDLAQNYADLIVFSVRKSDYSKARNAYRRSLELASHYPEDEELSVRMNRVFGLSRALNDRRQGWRLKDMLSDIKEEAETAETPATTPLADIYAINAIISFAHQDFDTAKLDGQRAVALFAQAQDNLHSPYRKMATELAACQKNCKGTFRPENYYLDGRAAYDPNRGYNLQYSHRRDYNSNSQYYQAKYGLKK